MAVGKFLAVAGFLAGRDCQILQIDRDSLRVVSFLSRRDLQILLVEPAKKTKTAKFCRPTHMGNNRRILLCEWSGFVAFSWPKNGAPSSN